MRTWNAGPVAVDTAAERARDADRCLLVSVGGSRFAVPAQRVLAVSELPPVSALPFSPPWLRGLARVGGGVVAVIDLARLLTLGSAPDEPGERVAFDEEAVRETLIVVRASDSALDAGLAVRGIARLVTLAGVPGRPLATGELDAWRSILVAGLVPDPIGADRSPVAVLDVDRLLRDARQELDA